MSFLRRRDILHRALAAAVCLALAVTAVAQFRARKHQGPRALALVEWPAKGGSPRVIPVTILINGRYYDASIYKADPVPMALEPGTVYEVEQSGQSRGIVTLTRARQANNGAWLAEAHFQSTEQLAAGRRRRSAPKATEAPEGPPRLRRGTPSSEAKAQPPASPPPRGPDEPPVLSKPAGEQTTPQPAPAPASAAPPQTKPAQPDHPILRRGRPSAEQAENLPGNVEQNAPPKTSATPVGETGSKAAGPGKVLTAISDAGGPLPSSFALPWKAEDREKTRAGMMQLAAAALQDYARTHGDTHPGELQDAELRAFDLSSSNEPIFVLMARAREAPPETRRTSARARNAKAAPPRESNSIGLTFWITVAVRENYDGRLLKLKTWATDSKHLDAYPRAELIDAVDADGDGLGELLFREIYDLGQNFVLYRAIGGTLSELYNSAELQQ